jgi:hypothetical protein
MDGQGRGLAIAGIPMIKHAIEAGKDIWVTTDRYGERKIKPHRIVENELHCDVLLVEKLGDSAQRNAVMNINEIHEVSFGKTTLG